jgi:hypothetical protein
MMWKWYATANPDFVWMVLKEYFRMKAQGSRLKRIN